MHQSQKNLQPNLAKLTLGAVGVVYGDIGTSPLYAFRESVAAAGTNIAPEAVLGVLSLILWTLFLIVTLKYVVLLLRADNHGEGGILSLMSLVRNVVGGKKSWIFWMGVAGVAFFYGDAIITPAISVLSAVEGLKLITPVFEPYVLTIAIAILVALFCVQSLGTEKVARFCGPLMLLWFAALAWGGILHIKDSPLVWQAFNPRYAIYFLTHHGMASFIAMGAVFLSVTGAEALYADLGHFGKKPIRIAWLGIAMPALILNYLGQAAFVLSHPESAHDSFFLLYPDWALIPMVILATLATVIASQAVITGAYSLTHQAVQLGLLPRLRVRYTSANQKGQIYMPHVNWLLLIGVIVLIDLFRSSSALAAAYGIAVTGTMVMTAFLAAVVFHKLWRWPLVVTILVVAPLLLLDITFLLANLLKFFHGGFMPVIFSAALMTIIYVWVKGSESLNHYAQTHSFTMKQLAAQLEAHPPARIEGTAVFLSSNPDYAPSALVHNLMHNKVLHQRNILITINYTNEPIVSESKRVQIVERNQDFVRVFFCFGYMESPNVLNAIRLLGFEGVEIDLHHTTFFISRRNILPSKSFGMPLWQDRLFIMLANNASDAAVYFNIPRARVVEIGVQMTV
jgi:KUP system potassium uptake protein